MMSSSAEIDVGNPRRPFSELSAKLLYGALKDVEEAMNDEELQMVRMSRQIPRKAMEERPSNVVGKGFGGTVARKGYELTVGKLKAAEATKKAEEASRKRVSPSAGISLEDIMNTGKK